MSQRERGGERERVFCLKKKKPCFVLLHAVFRASGDADRSADDDDAERVNESDDYQTDESGDFPLLAAQIETIRRQRGQRLRPRGKQ